jgi:PAS domain S-box-containing protein
MSGADKLCTYFNKPWLDFTGRSMDEELGNGWTEGVHPNDFQRCLDTYTQSFERREKFSMEFRLRRHDGEYRWIFYVGVPRSSPGNSSFAGCIGCALDVTERKLAEKALASVSGRLIQAQEQERKRIARELHDDVNQRLALLQTDLNQVRENLPNSRADLRGCMEELQERLSEASNEVIAISHRLHSSKLEYLGLVAACKGFCKEIAEHHKMPIEFNAHSIPFTVPQDVSLTVFRVLQESLQNAIKYSGAKRTEVQLCGISGEIRLTVRDNGIGFDVDEAMSNHGLGFISMRERVSLVNGTILIKSKLMAGTEIEARVPLIDANETSKLRPVGA